MKVRLCLAVLLLLAATACKNPPVEPPPQRPENNLDFAALYGRNCAGCHGTDGQGGAAIGLANPVYLAIADDATIQRVTAEGVMGTAMPAFAQHAGGSLTDAQIAVVVNGIRAHWSKPGILNGAEVPPYSSTGPGDPVHGAAVYASFCSSCHGPEGRGAKDGRGTPKGSSIVDGSFLGLVSDQGLRTTVIAGRPELGAPDWRNDQPGKPMAAQDVSDVVAWLAAQRPRFPGQPYAAPAQPKLEGELR